MYTKFNLIIITVSRKLLAGWDPLHQEGHGNVDDYAEFFRKTNISESDDNERGLLARVEGRAEFVLAKFAGDDLWTKCKAGHIVTERATAIAGAAQGAEGLQAAGAS